MLPFLLFGSRSVGPPQLGELIPLRVRGVGSGIGTLVSWSAAAIVTGFYLDYAERVKPWFAW